jgi:hypothetical protein
MDFKPPNYPWYTPELRDMIDLVAVTGMVLDSKAEELTGNLGPILGRIMYYLIVFYRPLLQLRLRFNFAGLLIEAKLRNVFMRSLGKLLSSKGKEKVTAMPQGLRIE